MNALKPVAAALVLALAAGGLGCAAPTEEAPTKESAPIGKQQQPITQVLAGAQGIFNVAGMIQQTITYGRPISTGDIYAEQLRLQADIDALRGTFSTQVNAILVETKATAMNDFDASTTTLWNARRDMAPGAEQEFSTYVRTQQTVLSFEGLRAFNTTLLGDDLAGNGLIDLVADSMSPNGRPDFSKGNDLGKLVLHARTVQLEAFSILSQVWAGSFWNLEKLRAELYANLDAQEARFFERMKGFNDSYIRLAAERFDQEYAGAAYGLYNVEEVLRNWNLVTDGTRLDVTPRIAIVNATYGTMQQDVSGALALKCNREGVCNRTFSAPEMGGKYAQAQGTLTVQYRCEGIPGVKSFYWDEANGKPFVLSCTALDSAAGEYRNEAGDTFMMKGDRFGTAMWTRFDAAANMTGIGVCANDAATGGIVCQDSLSRTFQATSTMVAERDGATGERSVTWKGVRWTAVTQ